MAAKTECLIAVVMRGNLSSTMLALGIDIGGSAIKYAVIRDRRAEGLPMQDLGVARSDSYASPSREHIVECIRSAIVCVRNGVWSNPQNRAPLTAVEMVDRIGLCLPGLFDQRTRTLTRAVNVPALVGVCIDDLLAQALDCDAIAGRASLPRASICTDAFAAAYDYVSSRVPPLQGRTLAVSLGTGVGACVLDDTTPLIVSAGGPGHLGHMDVSFVDDGSHTPVGPDGARGTLEAYIGLRALQARYGQQLERLPSSRVAMLPEPPIRALVRALRLAHAIYRPDTIALLGGVGMLLSPILKELHAAIADELTSLARPHWQLIAGDDPFHAARGAARLALSS